MCKSTKSRVLQGETGFRRTPRDGDGVRKFSLSCKTGRGWEKTKPCRAGAKIPFFGPAPPRPASLPSLIGDLIIEKISKNVHQHLEVLVNHYLLVALAIVPNSNYF